MADVKITVVKKLANRDLADEYGNDVKLPCDSFDVGDEFVVKDLRMPEGFCSWAWADIQRDVAVLALGGSFDWVRKVGTGIACCTDGFRPVVFKLERIER
ncbi:MAG: TIGR04076 family protein [Candidatus Brockarchaeota archaeon]|nr:TIGR04076 family protein [Candidatus Brockarchaeota archaeon]